MIPHETRVALARERREMLLSEAVAHRSAKAARMHREGARSGALGRPGNPMRRRLQGFLALLGVGDARRGRRVVTSSVGLCVELRDGGEVLLRPITRDDAPLLVDAFARLSDDSRRARFLGPKTALSPAELRYLTAVDHRDHVAIVAITPVDGRAVGVARFVRDADDPTSADLALVVVDEWQRRGLGTELFECLTRSAARAGLRRFTALVASDNVAVIALLDGLDGRAHLVGNEFGVLEFEIGLVPSAPATEAAGAANRGTACPDRRLARRASAAARRLYEAEVALHIAHQTHEDAWIAAAGSKLHDALVDSMSARRELDSSSTSAALPGACEPAIDGDLGFQRGLSPRHPPFHQHPRDRENTAHTARPVRAGSRSSLGRCLHERQP